MRQLAMVPILLMISCGSAGVVESSSPGPKPSSADVSIVQSLLDLERAADRVITQIHWDAADPNVRKMGDALAHSHDERIERLKPFLAQYGPAGPAGPAALEDHTPCFAVVAPGTPLTPVEDRTLLDRFLLHHDCGQLRARILEKSRSEAAQRLAADLLSSFDADVRLIHRVRGDR